MTTEGAGVFANIPASRQDAYIFDSTAAKNVKLAEAILSDYNYSAVLGKNGLEQISGNAGGLTIDGKSVALTGHSLAQLITGTDINSPLVLASSDAASLLAKASDNLATINNKAYTCLLYTSPSPRDS